MRLLSALSLVVSVAAVMLTMQSPPSASARDYDCADFATQEEAQEYLLPGDPYGLDADSDGVACEDLPSGGSGGGSETTTPPPPPPPYRLSKPAARSASKHLIRNLVRRSARLDSMSFHGCQRLGERRVDCKFSANGATPTQRVTCSYTVAVRARNRHPSPRLSHHRCDTQVIAVLSYARAKRAMQAEANHIAGKRASLEVARFSPRKFEGWAEWTQPSKTPGRSESCMVEMRAELLNSDALLVQAEEATCQPLG